MLLTLGAAFGISVLQPDRPREWRFEPAWTAQLSSPATTLKLAAISSESKADLLVIGDSGVRVLDAKSGKPVFEQPLSPGSFATPADVDADGRLDAITFESKGAQVQARAIGLRDGGERWKRLFQVVGTPDRAAAIDHEGFGRAGAVLHTNAGELVGLNADGSERFRGVGPGGEIVSLDTVSVGRSQLTLCAVKQVLSVIDASGAPRWRREVPFGVRRARSLEPTVGESVIVFSDEQGNLTALAGLTGSELWTKQLGQPATELRLAEVDGDPSALELVVGGKRGGVWAFSVQGKEVFGSNTGSGKITEISAILPEGGNRESLLLAEESGRVQIVTETGKRVAEHSIPGGLTRLLVTRLDAQQLLVASGNNLLTAEQLTSHAPSALYSPLVAGVLGCLVIALVGLIMARQKPPPPARISAQLMTIEAQKARKIMLRESIRELSQLSGQLSPQDMLARLRELREQLADADKRLLELGADLKPEIFRCAQCGGPLEIGAERCEYCGATVVA